MLILASKSPRRQEILRQAGIEFVVRTADVPEVRMAGESPADYVRRLAGEKAAAVAAPGELVLGADTIVVVDGIILEKPVDSADAVRMLRLLAGRSHEVLTGVSLGGASEVVATTVVFSPLSDAGIAAYVASGEPFDKAGAYAIQGLASKFIERIDGCYFNVVGLPISRVYRMLQSVL